MPNAQAISTKTSESTSSPTRVLPMVRAHNQRPRVSTFMRARVNELENSPLQ